MCWQQPLVSARTIPARAHSASGRDLSYENGWAWFGDTGGHRALQLRARHFHIGALLRVLEMAQEWLHRRRSMRGRSWVYDIVLGRNL